MHAIFMLYGKFEEVERMLRDMRAQKHLITMTKGDEKTSVWMEAQVRILPGGLYEYIFPETDMDVVLTTLRFDQENPYKLDKKILGIDVFKKVKEYLKIEDIPKFKTDRKLLWLAQNVSVIPIGIRKDRHSINPDGPYAGWMSERI